MTLLSPKAMEYFKVNTTPLLKMGYGDSAPIKSVLHYKGGLSTLMDILRKEKEIKKWLKTRMAWVGCTNGETSQSMLDSAHCETAFKAFEKAKAGLKRPLTRGKPTLSVVGGSFSMGRIIIGHPVACYRRPKQKLSPQKVDCTVSISASVSPESVSALFAKITNAAFRYHMAGGAISLTVHYALGFAKPNPETKAEGLLISLDIPLTSGSLAAFSASVQFFRAMAIPLAKVFSGEYDDSLPILKPLDKKMVEITGRVSDADGILQQLKIIEA